MVEMPLRAAKILVVLACLLSLAGMALGQSYSVNYRGQQQEDLTCMQAEITVDDQKIVYRNDPSTNCFGFPSIQFDDTPVIGGKPNSFTIDWSLMVDELQMQDNDRLHIHLPGFTGGTNTFGIMGPAIDTAVKGALYTPNFKSEAVKGDVASPLGERADFGALVGIWGISCGTEENLYMDRAKVDNLRTAEWDPATEMLKVVLKAQRYAPYNKFNGRHDGYTGVPGDASSTSGAPAVTTGGWVAPSDGFNGLSIPHTETTVPATPCAQNRGCPRGNHLQAMEYSMQGPSIAKGTSATALSNTVNDNSASSRPMEAVVTSISYGNDGYIAAPGYRVCGIYVDASKLHREQLAGQITNGLGPLPPFGGIDKNWYKAAFIRRFAATRCTGGFTNAAGQVTRPGMSPETCSVDKSKTAASLANFWQVPFDGDTERVVGFQFTTARQMLPLAAGASAAGTLVAPSFSYARAKGRTTGSNNDNCITVTLMPSVTFVSGSAATQITIEGLTGSGSSDTDILPLYMDNKCTTRFTELVGSNGAPIKNFRPVNGGGLASYDNNQQTYRPFGQANRLASGSAWSATDTTTGLKLQGTATQWEYLDNVDWHTRANRGTISGLTTGDANKDVSAEGSFFGGSLTGVKGVVASTGKGSKLSSPVGDLSTADGNAKFSKNEGKLTVNLSPGYFLQKGELLVFSFMLKNGGEPVASRELTVSATGSFCNSDDGFCDGVAEKTLNIQGNAIANGGKLLEVKAASFVTSKIFQASSDPDSLATIFVTLASNVELKQPDASADSKIFITGLCGFETGTDILLYQNQKSGGLPYENKYPIEAVRSKNDLPGLSADDSKHINHQAKYTTDGTNGRLEIKLGSAGFVAESEYAFAFQLQTKKTANAACVPKISSSGGSVAIAEQEFAEPTNVGKVDAPQFTTLKIGQVTTRPDVMNFICVTLQHNFQFYSDSAVLDSSSQQSAGYIESKITISGLTGTQSDSTNTISKGLALAYCPTEVPYFDELTTQHTSTQFQPDSTAFALKRYRTNTDPTCLTPSTGGNTQKCIPGNPYTPDTALDTDVAGRSWFGGQTVGKDSFSWDQATGTAVLTVDPDITSLKITEPASPKGGIPKNAEIVFALPLKNSKEASDCKTVTFEASGRITQKATMVNTKTGRALQDGEMDGDACPLKVYAPGFLVKKITQATSVTGDENVMTVSLRTNVDFASKTSGQASWITISGLTGTATGDTDSLPISAPNFRFSPKFEKNQGIWKSDGTLVLKLDAGANDACVPPTVWAAGPFFSKASGTVPVQAPFAIGGSDASGLTVAQSLGPGATVVVSGSTVVTSAGGLRSSQPTTCIKAGFLYVFQFSILNPSKEQQAPTVQIGGRFRDDKNSEVVVPPAVIDSPIIEDLLSVPMLISDQVLTTYKIGQLVPAPGATNVICVTIQSSKDLESKDSELLSTITISGLDGFDADAQDLQLLRNDGVTQITPRIGNPKAGDAYAVGGVFKARNTADTTTNHGYVRYTGKTDGRITMEIVGCQSECSAGQRTGAGHAQHMQKNVDHKFCFALKNPGSEMACKDVEFRVSNKGKISTVKAKLDRTTTIEDYPAQSACPGYVAAPGFVVKNWRSSSNITGDVAVIHMTIASNFDLAAGDKIHVTGLSSYTRACATPPCDVGIDVTRVAVSRRYGKPYMNGVRNVKGFGVSDAGATASERQNFAVAIQSYDLSGTKEGGAFTSTFGDNAKWGIAGDTEATASSLHFTVVKGATVKSSDIRTSADATYFDVVFKLNNKGAATSAAPIQIAIEKSQVTYTAQTMNAGQTAPVMGISNAGSGGMAITYTPMKTIYGGESLILTLPKFTRDSNGMLFGVTSSPSEAFMTYSTWADWKAYGTDEDYARAFFTNGWTADGIKAKSGDSGQTGERWNYPNVNAKVTTDADYNHDTGVLVLDSTDPGVGQNKDYWYAATEDNLYQGRVTPVAQQGTMAGTSTTTQTGVLNNPPTGTPLPNTAEQKPGQVDLPEATADYYLDNGEALDPVMGAAAYAERNANTGASVNGFQRPHAVVLNSDAVKIGAAALAGGFGVRATGVAQRYNNLPAPMPTGVYTPVDNYDGTPPFKGIPAKYQPSKRDNFYKGMLMKCWIGDSDKATDYSADADNDMGKNGVDEGTQYRKSAAGGVTELLPPPYRTPGSAFGDVLVQNNAGTVLAPAPVAFLTANDITNGQAFAKAGVSRILETRVIQASFRQIDYVPRKKGGCHFDSTVNSAAFTAVSHPAYTVASTDPTKATLVNYNAYANVNPAATPGQNGCQDEVPGFPAIVRLESPFSRALDPDTLCYIQRKSHVGVYTGMTAMVGDQEYLLKQGAANMYTVSHVASEMIDSLGNAVDRKVPRSYSTEDSGMSATGLRGSGNMYGFFKDGVGLSGQPYTIYSQLELVAKKGSAVSVGETVTITIPTSAQIFPPDNMNAPITPSVKKGSPVRRDGATTLADATRISHVLLVPLSPACSIVGAYGVQSGCQSGNGKGGAFDVMLSAQWPYAYDSENKNDITGYPMTVFGGQSTVIKTMADKHSQNLPIRPLEGALGAAATAGSVQGIDLDGVLDATKDTFALAVTATSAGSVGARLQTSSKQATGSVAGAGSIVGGVTIGVTAGATVGSRFTDDINPNAIVDTLFTVVKELDAIALTSGTARVAANRAPRLPNSPVTLIHGGCGTIPTSDSLVGLAATLPYAVCLALAGGVAHNQELVIGTGTDVNQLGDQILAPVSSPATKYTPRANTAGATTTGPAGTVKNLFRPRRNQFNVVVMGPQSITGEVGQRVTPVVADKHAAGKAYGSAPNTPDYGTYAPLARTGTNAKTGFFEEAGDNLGLGAYILVGVYKQGTSDRFVWANEANKGTQKSAMPTQADVNANLVVQRWLGTSREVIELSKIPSGLIGGNTANRPTGASVYPSPAGHVPRYQARIGGGYSIGRYAYGVSNIMRVRSDVTSMARPTGHKWTAISNTSPHPYGTILPKTATEQTKDGILSSFMAVPHSVRDAAGSHPTGHSQATTAPTMEEAFVYGRTTLPLPQVIHTDKHVAAGESAAAQTNFLSRGTCGVQGTTTANGVGTAASFTIDVVSEPTTKSLKESCLADTFNPGQPFSRNVYIEKGMDVYIVSSIFDTLIQRPEPPRKHLGKTINNWAQTISSGWYATSSTSLKGGADFFPGDAASGASISNAAPVGLPQVAAQGLGRTMTNDNQRFGMIQTLGTPVIKGTAVVGGGWTSTPTAAGGVGITKDATNQYGFDQDFRLYSVLGPFMRAARIKDVYDGSKIVNAAQSKFPGILTIHGPDGFTSTDEHREFDIFNLGADKPTEVSIVNNGVLNVPAYYDAWKNNALWSMAPVAGTTYLKANDRTTQIHLYNHTYVESNKVLTFCNPLQGDLNNAPGSAIMTDISDSQVRHTATSLPTLGTGNTEFLLYSESSGAIVASTAVNSPLGTINTQKISNGRADTAPGVWNVPRRHSICRKMVTGNPLVTWQDMAGTAASGGSNAADVTKARARFTESVQFNNVLNQDPSPNMRAMVTYVEPTKIPVGEGFIPPGSTACLYSKFPKFYKAKTCGSLEIQGKNFKITLDGAQDIPDWFEMSPPVEIAFDKFSDFDATTNPEMLKDKDGKDIPKSEQKFGLNTYSKELCLGDFVRMSVSKKPEGAADYFYTVSHSATRQIPEDVLAKVDKKLNDQRRRHLLETTVCPTGFDARLLTIGSPLHEACACENSACGKSEAVCKTSKNGDTFTWNQVLMLERVCRVKKDEAAYDPTGAIVGGVIGGFFGLLLLLLLFYFCCLRKKEVPPTARAVPMQEPAKPLAPVYLPQPYPSLSEQFAPAPMPAYPGMMMEGGVVQPTGQPTLYSSMQGVVAFPPPGMVETYPPQPGTYLAPYGVVPQPLM